MITLKNKIERILIDCNRVAKGKYVVFHSNEALRRILDEIDKEQKILRPAVRWFAGEMETDLKKNDFKGGWLDGELGYYREKALKHLVTLKDIDSIKYITITSKKEAIAHCVKSANYSMMLAHNIIDELYKNAVKETK
ncbi:MAG: hypothetical protein KAW56_07925 [Candidatus Marinimicrobia bacterium]|nr:hypothetical protein [Candidatus Neomarinimicrobiota bacterium]